MLHIALVDDDESCIRTLEQFITRYCEEAGIEFQTHAYGNGIEFLEKGGRSFDIVFLDIKMPMLNGMDTAKRLREIDDNVCIIFITTLAQYAIKGYEVGALDFILKPISYSDFKYRFFKAAQYAQRRRADDIVLSFDRNLRRIAISDIEYVEVKRHHILYHTVNEDIEVLDSLSAAEKKLQGHGFFKCNSSYLVNFRFVHEISGNKVRVGDEWLAISRPQKKAFIDAFTAYIGG